MAKTAFLPRQEVPQPDPLNQGAYTWPRARYDVVDNYPVDISGQLDSGETCSSLAISDRLGVTVSSSSVTSAGVITITISQGGEGSLKAKVTTSAGRVLVVPMQWRATYDTRADAYRQ